MPMYIGTLLVVCLTVSQMSTQPGHTKKDIDEDTDINKDETVAFMEHCSFSEGMCEMSQCSRRQEGAWERVSHAAGGPDSDHTILPNNGSNRPGLFMHSSTVSGQEGDSAWLESRRMTPGRTCNVQCLQFFYYHSGGAQDQLNIWIREFQDEMDSEGRLRLMGQITGPPTHHWLLHHVSLNATGSFQVAFEVRRGAGNSTGGFSIDDINLSETECPDFTWQIKDFENNQTTSAYSTYLYSPRLYSKNGYAHQVALRYLGSYTGVHVRLVSGQYDDQLQWPCPWRQVFFVSLDQNPQTQLQMSEQNSTDSTETNSDGELVWGNPSEVGTNYTDENSEQFSANALWGWSFFGALPDMKTRNILKGGDAILLFSIQDVSSLLENSSIPCPKLPPVKILPQGNHDGLPCTTKIITTTLLPTTTTWPEWPPTTTTTTRLPTTTITRPPTTTTTTRPPTTTITWHPTTNATRPPTSTTTRTPTTTTTTWPPTTTITRLPTTTITRHRTTTITTRPPTTPTIRLPTTTTRPQTTIIRPPTRTPPRAPTTTTTWSRTTITRPPTRTTPSPPTTTTRPRTATSTRRRTTTTRPRTTTTRPRTTTTRPHTTTITRPPTTTTIRPRTTTTRPRTTTTTSPRTTTTTRLHTTTTRLRTTTTTRPRTTTTRRHTTTTTRPRTTTTTRPPTTTITRPRTTTTTRPRTTTTTRPRTTTTRPRTTTTRPRTTTTTRPRTTTTRPRTTTTRPRTTTTTRPRMYNHH